jgi:hypothetical protein
VPSGDKRLRTGWLSEPVYIRRAVSVGPFRFNLSKGGIGLSPGIKGLRIGPGPLGNYIHMAGRRWHHRPPHQRKTPTHLPHNVVDDTDFGLARKRAAVS